MSTPALPCALCCGAHSWERCPRLTELRSGDCPDCERKTAELVRLERRNRELEDRIAKCREVLR